MHWYLYCVRRARRPAVYYALERSRDHSCPPHQQRDPAAASLGCCGEQDSTTVLTAPAACRTAGIRNLLPPPQQAGQHWCLSLPPVGSQIRAASTKTPPANGRRCHRRFSVALHCLRISFHPLNPSTEHPCSPLARSRVHITYPSSIVPSALPPSDRKVLSVP